MENNEENKRKLRKGKNDLQKARYNNQERNDEMILNRD